MNKLEYLCLKLAEECGELAQQASKTAVFGPTSICPYNKNETFDNFLSEVSDVLILASLLVSYVRPGTDLVVSDKDYEEKERKLNYYYEQMQLAKHSKET